MITKEKLKEVLGLLAFTNKDEIYSKEIGKVLLKVDFKNKKLIYPKNLIIHDETTCNFAKPENFVVFECVCRLLEKGYKAQSIELEPKWKLGGEEKSGKADILVKDRENKPYLLIECKTAGDSKEPTKNSEFSKEWERMKNDGGQLFSYFQQEREVEFLCLYTSDLEASSNSKKLVYKSYIIKVKDNEDFLKQSKLKGFKDAKNNKELVEIWKETYDTEYQENGIFESQIQAYKITTLKPNLESLSPISQSEIQRKRHEWATILRANAVGDRTLALNKLMNLFLCKITDELDNKDDLQFTWNGRSADSPFDLVDRLQKLYKIGMEKYLNQNITYHSKDSIEQAFSENFKDIVIKEKIQNIFNDLKYFSNGDFNFIEVYNESLFNQNFIILVSIVESLKNVGFTKKADSHILGDYFESYIHDMPQQEGQYFTPVPLVNFIISSLPVIKNAKVLDFSCGAGHFLTQYAELNKAYYKDKKPYFLGVDKDQRLAKIAKIASFMHQEAMNIYAYDSLQKAENEIENKEHQKAINNNSFNVLISNPPYSVNGFLDTLDISSRQDYEIFSQNLVINTNNAIECFFIEKAAKALQSKGLLALVLPNSLLNKDGIYARTRELLLKDFYIISICELGSATFFKTGTNCIILFAMRKQRESDTHTSDNDIFKDFHKLLLENNFCILKKSYKNFLPLLESYCLFQNYDKNDFIALLELKIAENSALFNHEIFKEYENAYNEFIAKEKKIYNDKIEKMKCEKREEFKKENPFTPSQSKAEFIRKIECEKFLYFCYCYDSNPLIIKAPKDLKEQKKFLGYEWSNTKGRQGIVYLNASSITELKSTLYNPKDRFDENKLNVYILQEYLNKIDKSVLDADFSTLQDFSQVLKKQIPSILEPFAFKTRLIDMLDFSNANFNKAINLNSSLQDGGEAIQNPFANSKYELVRLGEILKSLGKGKRPASFENKSGTINFYKSSLEVYKCDEADFNTEALIIGDGGSANIHYENGKFSSSDHTYIFTNLNNEISLRYVYFLIRNHLEILEAGFKGIALKNIAKRFIENEVKIPKPPLAIQKQIVAECEEVEKQFNTIRMSIEEYKSLIKAILIKCGIVKDTITGGGAFEFSGIDEFINALLENIKSLAKQIDFSLLERLFGRHFEQSEESKESKDNTTFNSGFFANNELNTLLASLPTPPPHGWERRKLKKYVSMSGGNGFPKEYQGNKDSSQIPFIKVSDMNSLENQREITISNNYVTQDIVKALSLKIFPKDTIAFPKVGMAIHTNKKRILKVPCIVDNNIMGVNVLRNKIDELNYKFLFLVFDFCIDLKDVANNANPPSINNANLENIQIPLPPLKEQEKIVAVIENIENQISNLQDKSQSLEDIKGQILQKYL